MTTTAARQHVEVTLRVPLDGYALTVAGIVALQAAWLGYLASRGWFYGDDLSYMSGATGRTLDWGYLTAPLNDHFVPGVRLAFWLMRHTTKLDYSTTILFRIAIQVATTLLLYRLLVLLVGRRPGVLAILGWYAMSPLIMPGFLWLTTSVHLMAAQLLVILTLIFHIRFTVTGRLPLAVGCAVSLLGAVAFWEMTAVTAVWLPLISLGFLHPGSLRARILAMLRRWPEWLLIIASVGCWLGLFITGPYGGSAHALSPGAALHVLRVGWLDAVGPALIGGPLRWFSVPDVFFSVADAPLALVVIAQLAVFAVLVVSWRRSKTCALFGWAIPTITFIFDMLLVAVGRAWLFGDLTPKAFNYLYELAVPIAVGAGLALLPSSPSAVARRVAEGSSAPRTSRVLPVGRLARAGMLASGVLVLVASVISAVTFSNRWAQNPSRAYVQALKASVRAAGPDVNLWDTRVPGDVLAAFSSGNHVSDVLALADVHAKFDDGASDPNIVRDNGKLAPARLVGVAYGVQRPGTLCTQLIHGVGTWTIPLSPELIQNEYFVKISYLQEQPSVLYLTVLDAGGGEIAPAGGASTELVGQLANAYLRLPLAAPRELVLRSRIAGSNICIGDVTVGFPLPEGGQ